MNQITDHAIPKIRQFFANTLSSSRRTKYAIIPPMKPMIIGNKYQAFVGFFVNLEGLGIELGFSFLGIPHFEQKLTESDNEIPQ